MLVRLISTATLRSRISVSSSRLVALEGEIDAVADALRAGDLDRLADMEGEIGRRHQPEPQLAGVQ